MITFQKIKWKNFLSTGDHFSEIDFTKNGTNLIVGTNGTGKSTVLDALTFSLFNKPFRKISKSQLINTVNEKDCRVEVEFSIAETEWKVIRSIKPNTLSPILKDLTFFPIDSTLPAKSVPNIIFLGLNNPKTNLIIKGLAIRFAQSVLFTVVA